ncbi:MAG TPA: citramalate synthase [Dehalococcoidales bacterium]|nr:citramalate synthase [Dehalococcoidales bacterium]
MDQLVQIYDTTLRDGAQREGISFSLADKLHIVQKLDELGVHYIEGGWPGSNPKDAEFFTQVKSLHLKYARVAAFGSTRKPNTRPENDANLKALLDTGMPIATLVGKNSSVQVEQVLKTSPEENLAMIYDSIRYLKEKGMEVFHDAEHFFDGYLADKEYALECLRTAVKAGATSLVLCDTNGGAMPDDVARAVKAACKVAGGVQVGMHAHNDGGLGVANTMAAVKAGATQVQGTINGYGERCGNANLCVIIPNLKLKMGINCISDQQLIKITEAARYVSEVANLMPDPFMPYVGANAFSHKAGFHVNALSKWKGSYQHVDPELVGNQLRITVSELSGKQNIVMKAGELGLKLSEDGKEAQKLLEQVKLQESLGFQYDQAEASFELLIRRVKPDYVPPFKLVDFMLVVEKRRRPSSRSASVDEMLSEAVVKVTVGDRMIHTAAEGNGPVNALDAALRKALVEFYPQLAKIKLVDYKVRILEGSAGTASQVRVLIESSDGANEWHTVGSSTNIIEASWLALADSLEYWLLKHNTN